MEVGMMWFDNDPKAALDVKLLRAAEYYAKKYGTKATVCMVNPKWLMTSPPAPLQMEEHHLERGEGLGEPLYMNGIEVRAMKEIMPGHLWIGVEAAP